MYLSEREKERRHEAVRKIMIREDLAALLVVGNGHCTGNPSFATGTFRYLADFFIFSYYGLLLLFREHEPIMLVPMELQETVAKKYSWIREVQLSLDYAETVTRLLRQKGLMRGRIGLVSMESLPARTYLALCERLPQVEWVDATSLLLPLRFTKGEEERGLLERAAELSDGAYCEVLAKIRPGMREYEVAGILEGYHRGHGADRTFNLIFSGPFPRSKDGVPFQGLPWCPGQRMIERGDCVHLEITTVYGGYWNQLIRAISVGTENAELTRFHRAACASLQSGLKTVKAGTLTSQFVASMGRTAEALGFKMTTPMGHFVGLDLIEGRVDHGSQVVLEPGIAMILHPRMDDSQGTRVILWGETYFMTQEGPIRLNKTDDTLHVV